MPPGVEPRPRSDSRLTALLCDGLACDGFIWKYLWDELADWLDVAHFHYRGHGRSGLPVDTEQIGVHALADDVDAVRLELGDPPVVLIGHSLGTQVALEAYRRRPEGIAALVLLCGSFGRVTYTFKGSEMLASVLPNLIEFATTHPIAARALWSNVPPKIAIALARLTGDINLANVRLEDVEPYFQHVSIVDFELFLRMLRAAGEHSAEDLLTQVRVPVLVIAGAKDSFTPAAVSEAMAQAIPGAELEVIASGTHLAPLEHHREISAKIVAFLGAHGLPR
ncbi:MAG TPA: alpha/beta hydrolase [Polyangiaceae bacterium]|nr:alpha/beta hydrolase [Polyangiaceae bacterium]